VKSTLTTAAGIWCVLLMAASSFAEPVRLRPGDSVRTGPRDTAQSPLSALLAKSRYPLSRVGVMVKQLEKDSDIVCFNADSLYNPASVSKLLTAAIAFEKLGTSFSFNTSVFHDGDFLLDSGVCSGNLYIKGAGDSYFVIERMWLFVQHLLCIGLKSIEKDIVLDDSYFDSTSIGPGFDEDDSSHPYVAPVDAISANFNCISIWDRPAQKTGAPVFVDILPKTKLVKLNVTAKTVAAGKAPVCTVTTQKSGEGTTVGVAGGLALDAKGAVHYKKVWQTWEYFGSVLKTLLDDNGIKVKGRIRHGLVPAAIMRDTFYVFPSIPLYDVVNHMLKISNNFMAEMVFKTLSAESDSTPGSWEKSSALALEWWKQKALPSVPRIKNGSGMGDSNRFSARQIVELLRYVWSQKSFLPEYLYSLPAAGIDGTLKSRFKDSRFKGIIRAKTGTLNDYGVSSIAGYVLMPKKTYAFAIFFHNCTNRKQTGHWEMQEKILELSVPQ
jgi:serine-type D-Ala-D-Ala carboxypeptidase/endopeptidase (penicillin-binding protein 4)